MKKRNFCIALITLLVTFSCQKGASQDEINVTTSQKNDWLNANLDDEFASSQKQVKSYLFSSQDFSKLTSSPDLHHLRFVLGYENGIIKIDAAGVNSVGKEINRINSKVLFATSNQDKLTDLNEVTVDLTRKRTAVLNKHLLSPKIAFTGIEAWQKKLDKVQDLNDITSYDGLRIRSYAMETEVITSIINKGGIEKVGLFLGLNSEGKMTTILVGLDKDNNIKKASATSKVVDGVYDFSQPSPPATGDDD
ncbi:hypothetical protein SAMN05444671_0361 [Flavobacterium sp. CF108]|uniref:hypothetical protein n=1 Tax=unclassified Flavobacterium TaxID=196869 RepID=UPI0008C9CEF6|nr:MULTISPECIES: hypothetical protein [unclassified Flavobacterium]SEP36330.1 hypothetical protein SAMN04487978_0775 [Flavobacterium sp. fv08]SHI09500.1 hypothetical protein SAMN05444671_0361 [Flavobacterium sp. CF108]